jgi:hypothetical protein
MPHRKGAGDHATCGAIRCIRHQVRSSRAYPLKCSYRITPQYPGSRTNFAYADVKWSNMIFSKRHGMKLFFCDSKGVMSMTLLPVVEA